MALEEKKDSNLKIRPRVLVADDEMNIRRIISFILGKEYDVTAVESGNKAYEKIREGMDFDVVSLDLQMPGMSGIETLKAIKQWKQDIEILIVTAHSDVESAKEALKLGAYDYIDKPFKKEALRAAVRRGIERRSVAISSKEAQEKLQFVKAQLMQSEKFAALGQLIAGVVHELNNPLGALMGISELLLMKEWSSKEAHNYLKKINESALICRDIIQKFLAFSRKSEKKREYGKINPYIDSTLELKKHDFKIANIQLVRQFADNMPGTMADFSELKQVFLNIVNNAHQAMEEHSRSGILTVKSEYNDKMIRISFQNTGPGILKENLQKIFEPLFTTKGIGKGTGLGLSVCYEIIKEHGGNIYVASEQGLGACFVIELPIVDQPIQSLPPQHEDDQNTMSQNILVLDGEETDRDILKQMAVNLGHHVDMEGDAQRGQQKIRDGDYDIIISNLNMPGLNAQQLHEYVGQVKPEKASRIVFIIGGMISDETKQFLARSGAPYIIKPFAIHDIQKVIHAALETSS